jgi:hypothetical protein
MFRFNAFSVIQKHKRYSNNLHFLLLDTMLADFSQSNNFRLFLGNWFAWFFANTSRKILQRRVKLSIIAFFHKL